MGWSQNSEFSIYEPMNLKNFSSTPFSTASNSQFHHPPQFVAPSQSLQPPYRHPIEQAGHSLAYPMYPFFLGQNGIEYGVSSSIHANNGVQGSCFMQTDGLSKEQERRIMDPYRTKVARIKRKLARQRSLSLQRNASSGASTQVDARRLTSSGADNSTDVNNSNDTKRDLYKFCTPDNKRLRVLLRKELKNSDVGSLGRIVLPKREAEGNLPTLSDKEGIQVMIKDVYSNQVWTLKYKFWSNNKSRMYVLENTGDFVKQNGLEIGDSLTLYEDESKNLYFSIIKLERIIAANPPSNHQHSDNENNYYSNNDHHHMYLPFTCQSRDEEETSLELLIEQLKHKEQQETNDLMSLPMDAAYSHRLPEEAKSFLSDADGVASMETYTPIAATTLQTSSTLLRGKAKSVDDFQLNNFDDCYGGLDMLPDVNHYNFSLVHARKTKKKIKGIQQATAGVSQDTSENPNKTIVPAALPQLTPTLVSLLEVIEPEVLYAGYDSSVPDSAWRIMTTLNMLGGRQVIAAVKWAKAIPGFRNLHLDDQMTLLQYSWMFLMAFALGWRSYRQSSGNLLCFAPDLIINEQRMSLPCMYDQCKHMLFVSSELQRLQVSYEEYLCMKTLLLLSSVPKEGLKSQELFDEIRMTYIKELGKAIVKREGNSSQNWQRFYQLTKLLDSMHEVVENLLTYCFQTFLDKTMSIEFPEMLAEIITNQIPKYSNGNIKKLLFHQK
nr:TcLec2/glucocorticoid receptor fusion protein [Ti plasmid binary vector pGZ13.0313]